MTGATSVARQELADRLAARREEIEQTILTRAYAVSDPGEVGNPEYLVGLREAVGVALDYGLVALGEGEGYSGSPPPELLSQARQAARNGVALETVLRRYFAGYTSLCDYLLSESVDKHLLADSVLRRALRVEASLFDRIIVAVADAYRGEADSQHHGAQHRRVALVRSLLAGEPVDGLQLDYDLEGWHLGVVALGPSSPHVLRDLASTLDRRLLLIRPGGEGVWAWLGGRRRLEAEAVGEAVSDSEVLLAVGEPGRGILGWRLTHHQARAALPVVRRSKARVVNYANVAIVTSVLKDEVAADSLSERYLAPLAQGRDGGAAARETLRAYFAAGRNVASAAAALGVSRPTVVNRLRAIEERIGRSADDCATEVETALRLQELGWFP